MCVDTPHSREQLIYQEESNYTHPYDRDTKPPPLLVTPYIKGISGKKIERRCKSMNIRTGFSSRRTLRHELERQEKRVEPLNINGVVYKIDCGC